MRPPAQTILLMALLAACSASRAEPSPECRADATDAAPACLGVGEPTPVSDGEALRSVAGGALAACSTDPLTGFYRDGVCRTGPDDRGVHVVCAEVDADFLAYTAGRGNDLSTPAPRVGFPGLAPGDRWCLCAARWEEARAAGHAPAVVLGATHPAALRSTTIDHLREHAR